MNKIGNYEILNSKTIKNIINLLKQQFCFKGNLEYVFLKSQKEKIYLINRNIELLDFQKLRIDALGLYFGKFYNDGFRLSIEGAQLIGKNCSCNIINLNQLQKHDWLKGIDISLNKENSFVILKSDDDFIGCAKVKNSIALNSVPSARRLKVVNEILY